MTRGVPERMNDNDDVTVVPFKNNKESQLDPTMAADCESWCWLVRSDGYIHKEVGAYNL